MIKSHELAKRLLDLPDKPVTIVMAAGGPYTAEFEVLGPPWWASFMGDVRIQVTQHGDSKSEDGK